MKSFSTAAFLASICASGALAHDIRTIVTGAGYDWEEHTATTEDGYILTAFRITRKTGEAQPEEYKPPILLMHGLFGESETFVQNTATTAPAFLMVDEGYDVWLGNNRGNKHSQDHTKLSEYSSAFWDFSWAEMGQYDVPAFVSLVKSTA